MDELLPKSNKISPSFSLLKKRPEINIWSNYISNMTVIIYLTDATF